jgi:hypothetical protein
MMKSNTMNVDVGDAARSALAAADDGDAVGEAFLEVVAAPRVILFVLAAAAAARSSLHHHRRYYEVVVLIVEKTLRYC